MTGLAPAAVLPLRALPGDAARAALAGLAPELAGAELTPLPGSGNNRLYRVDLPGRRLVVKHYFRHPAQPHDRLAAEFGFLRLAWDAGLRCVPEPLARDDAAGLALYSFVPGRRPEAGEVGAAEVGEALAFVEALQRRVRPAGGALGPAAEACFSVAEHLARIDARVARLAALPAAEELDAAAARFVARSLVPRWRALRARIARRLGERPPAWAGPLAPEDRIVSPSDFGFHNALRQPGGGLAFVDFEYAGWDDPAKLACDFFLQPAVPAPPPAFDAFAQGVAALARDAGGALARVALLRPALGVKWCCILLNDFLPVDAARRGFSAGAAGAAPARKAAQLEKAGALLNVLEGIEGGC